MRASMVGAALLAAVFAPGALSAQACLGLPSSVGQIGVAGTGSVVDGELELGGEFHVDVTGPASFRIGYNHGHEETVDTPGGAVSFDAGRRYTALAAYDLFLLDPSICAVGGGFYESDPGPGLEDSFGVALGFGIGKTLDAEAFTATIYAVPRYVRLWDNRAGDRGNMESNEFMADAGVTLGFRYLFVGGDLLLSTIRDAEPGLRLRVGVLF